MFGKKKQDPTLGTRLDSTHTIDAGYTSSDGGKIFFYGKRMIRKGILWRCGEARALVKKFPKVGSNERNVLLQPYKMIDGCELIRNGSARKLYGCEELTISLPVRIQTEKCSTFSRWG